MSNALPPTLKPGFIPKTDKQRGQQFKDWLKFIKKWSYWDFVKITGFGYGTMIVWTRGKIPRRTTMELLRIRVQDCPVLQWKQYT